MATIFSDSLWTLSKLFGLKQKIEMSIEAIKSVYFEKIIRRQASRKLPLTWSFYFDRVVDNNTTGCFSYQHEAHDAPVFPA
jgi:hypothetical protein